MNPIPLSRSVHERCRHYIDEGLSAGAAALCLRNSPANGILSAQLIRREGKASVVVTGRPAGHGKLVLYADFLQELIPQDPVIALFELRDALAKAYGKKVHHFGIAVVLERQGYTHQKVVGCERMQGARLKQRREAGHKHRIRAINQKLERIVLMNETSVKTNLTRLRGWAPCGHRLAVDAPFGRCGTQTLIFRVK